MDIIQNNLDRVKTPGPNDKVFKDECFYSFDSPESGSGLYVCLNRWIGVGRKYLEKYSNRTDNKIFLHIKKIKKVTIDVCFNCIILCDIFRRKSRKQRGFLKRCLSLPLTWRDVFKLKTKMSGTRN